MNFGNLIKDVTNGIAAISGGNITDSIGAIVVLAFYGVVALLGLIGLLKGLSRGILRQTVRSITVVVSAVASFILTQKLYPMLSQFLEGKTVGDLAALANFDLSTLGETAAVVESLDAETVQYILAAPIGLVILPLLFVIAFVIISALMLIVHAIVCALLGFKKHRNNPLTRLFGMALGLVQGVAVGALIFLPLYSVTGFLGTTVQTMEDGNEIKTAYVQYAEPFEECELKKIFLTNFKGEKAVTAVCTLKDGDETIDTQKLGKTLVNLIIEGKKLSGIDLNNITPEQKTALENIVKNVKDDEGLSAIMASVMRSAVKVVDQNPSIIPLEDEGVRSLVIEFVKIFADETATDVGEDLTTIKNVIFVFADNGVFSALSAEGADAAQILTAKDDQGKTIISKVIDELNGNERTKQLVTVLTKYAMSMVASSSGLGEEAEAMFEDIQDGLKEVAAIEKPAGLDLSNDDYKETPEFQAYATEIGNSVTNVLAEQDITIDDPEMKEEIGNLVAEFILEENIDTASLDDPSVVSEMLLKYFDAYAGSMGGEGE